MGFREAAILAPLLLAALAGCFGGDGEPAGTSPTFQTSPVPTTPTAGPATTTVTSAPTTSSPTNTSTPPPATPPTNATNTSAPPTSEPPLTLRVVIVNHTASINMSDTVRVEWRVETDPSRNVTINVTEVRYGNASSATNYTNSTGSEENATAPGTFNASFEVASNETVFIRAYAELNGTAYWSDEVETRVNVTHAVIESGLHFSEYSPDPIRIRAGEGIRWENEDGLAHTATSDSDAPAAFDTGDIEPDETSIVVYLDTPGTYDYHCSNHPATMSGTIVVSE